MGDIFLRDTFAAQPRLIVGGPDEDTLAGFSRDGTRLAFFRKVDDSPLSYDLWVAGADGSTPTRLAGPFDRSSWDVVDWSPTGDLLAVSSIRHESGLDDRPVIDLVRVDGSGASRLDVNIDAADPAWRPGEPSQLAFRGEDADGSGIYLAAHDGSGAVRLPIDHDGNPGNDEDFKNLTWSPSGDRLTFTTADTTPGSSEITSYRLHVATVGSAGEVVERHRVTSSTSSEYEYQPAWTPGGDQLIFHRMDIRDAIVLGPAGGGPIRDLGLVGSELIVSVSPDGTHIMAVDHSSLVVKELDLATGVITDGFSSDWSTVQAPTSQRLAP
jgi:Tol biopolymer transport system component